MAQGIGFVCSRCRHEVEAWSDGNPYYLDGAGRKHYAYHPDHENLARCIGNDEPHLCLACGKEFNVDSRAPEFACPACPSTDVSPTFELEGRRCPFCGEGVFGVDPEFVAIS